MNSATASPARHRWPPQIKYIVGNEACERFSYYGMKGILALYITNVLMQTQDQATNLIHLFGFANYFICFRARLNLYTKFHKDKIANSF